MIPRRKVTKEQAMLGVFGDEDEEEYEAPKVAKASFLTGISFVKGSQGTVDAESKARRKEREKQQEKEKEKGKEKSVRFVAKDEGRSAPSISLPSSFGASRPGLGSTNEGRGKKKSTKEPDAARPEWERYTKGFGSDMLKKMGFSGGGLKDGQGIAAPIEAVFKADRGGLGFGSKPKGRYSDEEEEDEETKEDNKKSSEPKLATTDQWKKSSSVSKRKQKTIYKTAEELLQEETSQPRQQVIIDMTRPQRYQEGAPSSTFPQRSESFETKMTAFEGRLRRLVELTEKDIRDINSKMKQENETIAKLEKDQVELKKRTTLANTQINHFSELLAAVIDCKGKLGELGGGDSLTEAEFLSSLFDSLKLRFPQEYQSFKVNSLAFALILPIMKEITRQWQPLPLKRQQQETTNQNEKEVLELFTIWRRLLEKDKGSGSTTISSTSEVDYFLKLVQEVLIPKIRSAITNEWNPQTPEPCLLLLEAWQPCLPPIAINYILDQFITPKLQMALENWSPRGKSTSTEDALLHRWLFPWIPLLGSSRLQPLYSIVKSKLGIAYQSWSPSHSLAPLAIVPWRNVFDSHWIEQLLVKTMVPKLIDEMKRFNVNPRHQTLEAIQTLFSWNEVLPLGYLVVILEETHFWIKWKKALETWLSVPNPNFQEVIRWYQGWKSLFPPHLLKHPTIKGHLIDALQTMNKAG